MASKVNTKFVVGLSAALLVVCAGVAGSAFIFLRKGATQHVAVGDKKLAAGEMQDAVTAYGKAVSKERTNTAYLTKWVSAMEKYAPENDAKFNKQYGEWIEGKRQLAVLQQGVLEPHLEYAKLRWDLVSESFNRESWDGFARQVEESIATFTAPGSSDKLKGYVGLARLRLTLESPDVSAESVKKPLELLDAGLAADPNNAEIAGSIILAHQVLAARAQRENRPEEAEAQNQLAMQRTEAILAKTPDNAGALGAMINQSLVRLRREVGEAGGAIKAEEASRKFNEEARPLYDRMYAALLAKPSVERSDLQNLRSAEMFLDGAAMRRTEEVLRSALAKKPGDVSLTIDLAELLASRGDFALAEAEISKVASMPRLPVSNAGLRLLQQRGPATGLQAMWTVRVWETTPPGAERDAMLVKAKELRTKLAEQVSPDSNVLRLVDAQLAYIENTNESNQRASQLLEKFNKETGGNVDSLALTAQLATRRNEPGKARDALRQLVQAQPFNIAALRVLLGLEMNLQNTEGAREVARAILTLDPSDERSKQVLDVTGAMAGSTTSTDPVVKALAELDQLAKENVADPKIDSILRDRLLALPADARQDQRIIVALAQAHLRLGERDKALALVNAALEKSPKSPTLLGLRAASMAENQMQANIAVIEANTDLSPIDQAIQKVAIYGQFGDSANAEAELAKATAIDKEHPSVVDMTFTRALASQNMTKAREQLEVAVRKNIDGFGGDTFRARMLLGEGKADQAAAVMKQIVDRGGAGPNLLRLQGRILMAAGNPQEAIVVFRSSLQARPNDPQVWTDLLEAQVQAGKLDEALSTAREGRRFAEGSPQFVNLLLKLEAQRGDRNEALRQRERLVRITPGDRTNLMELANIYIENGQGDLARGTIDKLKALPQDGGGFDLLVLEATLSARSGSFVNANKVFEDAIARTPADKRSVALYLTHAQFLLDQGQGDAAVTAAEAGREFQTKQVQEIDRWLSNVFVRFSQIEPMVKASKAVVAAGGDTKEQLFQKRVVEGLAQLGKFDEAEQELKKLPTGDSMDVDTLLIAAAVMEGKKNDAGERDLLNRAVSRGATAPMAFLRRGRYFLRAGNQRDALADATKAIELAPSNPTFLRERARMQQMLKDENAMFADLKAAARVAPLETQPIFVLLQELRAGGRDQEAEDLATELQGLRKTDGGFANQLAGFFLSVQNYDAARDFARKAYELDKAFTQQYLDVLLVGPAPNLAEVERVLTAAGDDALKNPGLIMARAKQRVAQNRMADAQRLSQDAVKLMDLDNADQFSAWYNDFRKVVEKNTDRFTALDQFAKAGVAPEWMTFFRASEQLALPATRAQAVKDLTTLASTSKRNATKYIIAKQLGGTHFQAGEYEPAAAAWKSGLVVQPDDLEMLNNLAYTLVKHLGKATEALPLAQRAHQLDPLSADIADTLGLVKLETGATDEAIALFVQARRGARNVNTVIQASIHLAEAHLKKGDKVAAKQAVKDLDNATTQTAPELLAPTKAELDALRLRIEAP